LRPSQEAGTKSGRQDSGVADTTGETHPDPHPSLFQEGIHLCLIPTLLVLLTSMLTELT
jgi:hypothetical protein